MSAEKAASLQDTLNAIAMSESHYKSLNQPIPPDLNASNMIVLKRMLTEVDGATEIKPDQDLDVN
ncbi:MAG: hypothetical protein HYX67_12060 [Candidatus Melainabacteria bacterium]|nr:hypothetical protein [Candidatus Melainabacteria bacterium]